MILVKKFNSGLASSGIWRGPFHLWILNSLSTPRLLKPRMPMSRPLCVCEIVLQYSKATHLGKKDTETIHSTQLYIFPFADT